MVIYIDEFIFKNFILDFIIISSTSLFCGTKIKIFRILIASVFGAICSLIYYFIPKNTWLIIIFNIFIVAILIYIAYGFNDLRDFFIKVLIFYLTIFIFGGASSAVIDVLKQDSTEANNLFNKYNMYIILIIFIATFYVIKTVLRIRKLRITKHDLLCNITIKINGYIVKTKAMIDTGNLLKDPITKNPVIVVEHNVLKNAIHKEILDNIDRILGGDFQGISYNVQEEYLTKLKIIPFFSIGNRKGMLLGLKADSVLIENIENVKKVDNVIIGIYNKKIGKQNEYNALLGLELM